MKSTNTVLAFLTLPIVSFCFPPGPSNGNRDVYPHAGSHGSTHPAHSALAADHSQHLNLKTSFPNNHNDILSYDSTRGKSNGARHAAFSRRDPKSNSLAADLSKLRIPPIKPGERIPALKLPHGPAHGAGRRPANHRPKLDLLHGLAEGGGHGLPTWDLPHGGLPHGKPKTGKPSGREHSRRAHPSGRPHTAQPEPRPKAGSHSGPGSHENPKHHAGKPEARTGAHAAGHNGTPTLHEKPGHHSEHHSGVSEHHSGKPKLHEKPGHHSEHRTGKPNGPKHNAPSPQQPETDVKEADQLLGQALKEDPGLAKLGPVV
ncbi:leucine rich repeat containing [Lambiella insularis]|nr:leucine rich repeat containing [Lambiella insularis]